MAIFVEEPCLNFENLNMHVVSFHILINFGGTQCMPAWLAIGMVWYKKYLS